ncbi:MAG: AMP-binding protein, partial [Burkholderiaceae bacterium]|nr:AMP-binding protein [Burkholderiaceae bacterium]
MTQDNTERRWLGAYPEGVPADVDVSAYGSLVDLLENNFARYSDRACVSFMGKELTYGEINKASLAMAAYFQSLGLVKGDRVAVMMPNVPQYPVVVAALMRTGLVVVNVNPLYTARELSFQLKDSGAKAIVIVENFAATLEACIADTSVKHVVLAAMGDMLGMLKGGLVNYVVRN